MIFLATLHIRLCIDACIMPEDLILIKFGGSLITNKSKTCSPKYKIIDGLCKAIGDILLQGKKIILIHGAGSFGHMKAKKWNISEGIDDPNKEFQYAAIKEIRSDMEKLNKIIISNLAQYSIDSVVYSPHKNGKGLGINYFLNKNFFELVKKNNVVVSYGDVVDCDNDQKFGILSGDDLCELISNKLKPSHVIFAIDGALGLIDDPNLPGGGNLIKEYTIGTKIVTNEVSNDVTGGMNLKLMRAKNCFKMGSRVSIINGNNPQMIINAINGKEFIGTEFFNQ